jgi:hypothetical protein
MGFNKVSKKLALLGMAILISSGCAFGTRSVELGYPPADNKSMGPATAEAAEVPENQRQFLSVMPFSDLREDQIEIGCVRNGLGMKTARVEAKNSVADWVTMATIMELEKAGFSVSRVANMDEPVTGPVLEGQIVRVFCDSYFSYSGEVIISARIALDENEIMNKTYTGKGSAGTNWGASSKSYGQSLSIALADAMSAIVADVVIALDE